MRERRIVLGAECEQTTRGPAPVCGPDCNRSVHGEGRTANACQSADTAHDQ